MYKVYMDPRQKSFCLPLQKSLYIYRVGYIGFLGYDEEQIHTGQIGQGELTHNILTAGCYSGAAGLVMTWRYLAFHLSGGPMDCTMHYHSVTLLQKTSTGIMACNLGHPGETMVHPEDAATCHESCMT